MPEARRIKISGIVQGVGFRPFVYRKALEHGIAGSVVNAADGVTIFAEGAGAALESFTRDLSGQAPPLALITAVHSEPADPLQLEGFTIERSESSATVDTLISPDICVCADCLAELADPADRRYRYPFINCTNCGPRYTIIRSLPYDRPSTSMAAFTMCPRCQREYEDPADRRFHAQPNACPACGPGLSLVDRRGGGIEGDPLGGAIEALRAGRIVAVKGLGGFHLAADACSEAAVSELRRRKGRVGGKPFAVMARDPAAAARFVHVGEEEERLLTSPRRPIVLLERRDTARIAEAVAPGQSTLGIMLPYTPLHHLLLEPFDCPLVMTSGNISEEPIAIGNEEALGRLAEIADLFLLHNRDIVLRADDSVVRFAAGATRQVRRSRGYAPQPVFLPRPLKQVLAVGPLLKNTLCFTRGERAFVSQHIGDLDNLEALGFFEEVEDHLRTAFELEPELIAHDLHPDYMSTGWAAERGRERGLPTVAVQHHRAHIAACLADAGWLEPVIGLALDGTGYGDDGAIWGGEVLAGPAHRLERKAHLQYVDLPGGDAAAREPWRCAVAHLVAAFGRVPEELPFLSSVDEEAVEFVLGMLSSRTNTFPTSSAGRLFDAVASLAGVRNVATYEAQAAMELEAVADPTCGEFYEMVVDSSQRPWRIRTAELFEQLVRDVRAKTALSLISARFHNALARTLADLCVRLREETGLDCVALSGGVFQNRLLLERLIGRLESAGFRVLAHEHVPCNDGGVSLGQAVIAAMSAEQIPWGVQNADWRGYRYAR